MRDPFTSLPNHLKENARRYYEALIFPLSPEAFDAINPQPKRNFEREVARIDKKYNGAGL